MEIKTARQASEAIERISELVEAVIHYNGNDDAANELRSLVNELDHWLTARWLVIASAD